MHWLTAPDVAVQISSQHGADLASAKAEVEQNLADGNLNLAVYQNTFASILDSTVRVRLSVLIRDPRGFGTFSDEISSAIVVVGLKFWQLTSDPDRSQRSVKGSDLEVEGWARALLGKRWSDYAYRVDSFSAITGANTVFFPVFMNLSGAPFLAPEDFRWRQLGAGGPVERRKLAPALSNRSLINYLRANGDLAPVERTQTRFSTVGLEHANFHVMNLGRAIQTIVDEEMNSTPSRPIGIFAASFNEKESVIVVEYQVSRSQNVVVGYRVGFRGPDSESSEMSQESSVDIPFAWDPTYVSLPVDSEGIRWARFDSHR